MGTYRPAEGKFDLILSVRFTPDEARPSVQEYGPRMFHWQKSFECASELLYSATDGQHQLGRLFVCPDSAASTTADLWLLLDPGTSYADARIWLAGTHVHLAGDERKRPFVITHELGHYLYGLRDEYKGPDHPETSCLGRAEDGTLPGACIMEGLWSDGDRFGSGGTGDSSEFLYGDVTDFCVECNHDRGTEESLCPNDPGVATNDDLAHDTMQSHTYQNPFHPSCRFRGTSCWSKMVDHYPELILPENLPDPTHPLAGPDPIEWIELVTEARFVVAVDRSERFHQVASWAWPHLQMALKQWVRLTRDEERHGAVVFSAEVLAAGLRQVTPSDRQRVHQAMRAIEPAPGTDLYGALRSAIRMFVEQPERSCTQVIVLISGSEHAAADEPLDLLPELIERGIRVYGLSIGPEGDFDRLQALAFGTGGSVFQVLRSPLFSPLHTIAGALSQIHTLSHEDDGVITVSANIPYPWDPDLPPLPASGNDDEFEVFIEEDCEEVTFLVYDEEGRDYGLELVDPVGEPVVLDQLKSNVTAEVEDVGRELLRRIERPVPGTWRGRVLREDKSAPDREVPVVHRAVLARSRRVHLTLTSARSLYGRGEIVRIAAKVTAPYDVAGIDWHGSAIGPDGVAESITLRAEANNGLVYGAFIPTKEGDYTVRCIADGRGGGAVIAHPLDEAAGGEGPRPGDPVAPFFRTGFLRVKVGRPPRPDAAMKPVTLEQGEQRTVAFDLRDVPFVPGVSRLVLGVGVQVTERPTDRRKDGRFVFDLEVAERAAPGMREGVIRTGGDGFILKDLLRIRGEKPPPIKISPERLTHPGRYRRRLQQPRGEK